MTETANRLAAVRRAMAEAELEALVVHQSENRRYLTGFTGSAGMPIVSPQAAALLVDSRYDERARREATGFEIIRIDGAPGETMTAYLNDLKAVKIGFEADTVSVSELARLQKAMPSAEWQATSGLVERIRAVKSEAEIAALRSAAQLTDQAMAFARAHARPGMTEKALAWALEVFMRENGAEALAFPIIVAGGPNGALPHHQPGDYPLAPNEPIVIDLGAQKDGYCGDLTRTMSLGAATDAEYESVYRIVDEANRRACEGLRPGMTGAEGDALARVLIAEAGHGDRFGHGLGHGVGLYVHEMPRLGSTADDTTLQPGMVFTIEPGIYLPGRFGVRVEDLVVLRENGAELLSHSPKDAVIPVG
jgi:Xaa-Pro aminopeptidase